MPRTIGAHGLARLIEEMLDHTSNSLEASELCRELALVKSSHLSDPEGAIDALIRFAIVGQLAPIASLMGGLEDGVGISVDQTSTR